MKLTMAAKTETSTGSDLFESRHASPMMIGRDEQPFDAEDYIFELKLDGERCLAYLDENETVLINPKGRQLQVQMPELANIHKQVNQRCILDGELHILLEGISSFDEVKRRSGMNNKIRINVAAKQAPISFVVFDILYGNGRQLTDLPLMERKEILAKTVTENERMPLARYIEEAGIDFFNAVKKRGLEGIIGKQKNSLYQMGKRTKDWVKIKNLLDGEFVVCGYLINTGSAASIILGQYNAQGQMQYKGHVTIGKNNEDFPPIKKQPQVESSPFNEELPSGNEQAIWVKPTLVCTVIFMAYNTKGGLRQPVFKTLRPDKNAREAVEPYG